MKARDKLFDWGYINKNKEDFQEAVRALSELIKIARNGNKEEKEEYKTDGNDNDSRESKRVKVEEEVKQDQTKRNEEVSAKITEALQGLSENTTDQEKENKLVEIEKSKNEGKISEEQKAKITEKKDELAIKDPQGYGRMMAEVLERKIAEFKLQIDKLGQVI